MSARKPAALLVVAWGLCAAAASASPPDLLKRATFVANTKDWWGTRFRQDIRLQWLSDRDVNGRVHHLYLHDLADPASSRALPLGDRRQVLAWLSQVTSLARGIALVWSDWDTEHPANDTHELGIFRVAPDGSARTVKLSALRLARYRGAAMSPQGPQIAWLTQERHTGKRVRVLLCVRELVGGGQRVVAYITGTEHDMWNGLYLQWLPGGRKLSFVWRDRLYTVPVPR